MKIELRSVKYAAFASQETSCFEATVYIDGVKSGDVRNEGHGGCNWYSPRGLEERLDAHAKTLPPVTAFDVTLEMDADLLIGELFSSWLMERDLKRLLASKLVFARDGKVLATKKIPAPQLARLLADPASLRARHSDSTVLNLVPFAEALTLYRASAEG